MGFVARSLHARGVSTERVAAAMARLVRGHATISTPAGGWVTVWDDMSANNPVEADRVACGLSLALAAPVVALSISKNGVTYSIYDGDGRCLDRYDSMPDYEGAVSDASRAEVAGRPDVLARFVRPDTPPDAIAEVLRGSFCDLPMEAERVRGARLAELLGIAPGRADIDWETIGSGDGFVEVKHALADLCRELFEAIRACDATGTAALLDRGAPLDAVDAYGRTPLERAVETEYPDYSYVSPRRLELVRLLLARGIAPAIVRGALFGAIVRRAQPLVLALVEAGADLSHADERGRTALHFAAAHGSADTVRLLLAAGADPAARDARGRTPLVEAQLRGNADAVALLRSAGTRGGQER